MALSAVRVAAYLRGGGGERARSCADARTSAVLLVWCVEGSAACNRTWGWGVRFLSAALRASQRISVLGREIPRTNPAADFYLLISKERLRTVCPQNCEQPFLQLHSSFCQYYYCSASLDLRGRNAHCVTAPTSLLYWPWRHSHLELKSRHDV